MTTPRLNTLVPVVLCLTLTSCSRTASIPSSDAKEAAPVDSSGVLLPVKVSGKWGYVNTSGQLVINPQFDYAQEFRESRAAVCIGKPCDWWATPGDSRWGFIDTTGKVIVTPQYGYVSSFSEGLALVCMGDCSPDTNKPSSTGYIDRGGKVVIPMQFGSAWDFKEGLAAVCIGICRWDKENKGYDGKFGFIDHSGHFVINPIYDFEESFNNGFAKVRLGKGNDEKTGYVDKAGKVIWQPSS